MHDPAKAAGLREEAEDLIARGELGRAFFLLSRRILSGAPLHEYSWLAKVLRRCVCQPSGYRLGLLSTFTLEPLRDVLRATALAQGFDLSLYFGGFQQLEQEVMDPDSRLARHEPQATIFAWRLADLSPGLWDMILEVDQQAVDAEVQAVLGRVRSVVEACKANLAKSHVLLHTFVSPAFSALGVIDFEHPRGQHRAVEALNSGLRELAESSVAVHLVDCDSLSRRAGLAWRDARHWFAARVPLGPEAMVEVSREYVKYVRALAGKTKKVLVLDLDNTLWGGILGEDGLDGIALGPEYPGNAFVALQQEVKRLSQRGTVLAINSKNNEADVRDAFDRHPHMVLKWGDFAATRINWRDKAVNMRELGEGLSLGLDSFVFLDDNEFELELVAGQIPEVSLVQVPREPSELPGLLSRIGYFDGVIYSEEDRRRGDLYRAQAKRAQLQRGSTDLESFYRSLGMRLTVYAVGDAEIPRVAQLTQRTNQFNMTTRRYSELDMRQFVHAPDCVVRAYRLEDRFGDNGIIGAVIARARDDEWYVDTFVMSCRVIGRTVETAILGLVAQEARQAGADVLVGEFIPTKKNAPARDVYERHGFRKVEETEAHTQWEKNLASEGLGVPEWFAVVGADRGS